MNLTKVIKFFEDPCEKFMTPQIATFNVIILLYY